ncbi:PKD domain-containing protein [Pseudomonadota bacterium]
MQGLQWSVLLSVAMSCSVSAAVQFIEPDPEDLAFIDPVRTERVNEFISIDSPSDSFFQIYRIHAPEASFIKVHFSHFDLPEGVMVEVSNTDRTEVYQYSMDQRGPFTFDASEGDNGTTSFSAMSITGSEAFIRILGRMDRFDPALHRMEIDSYLQGSGPSSIDGLIPGATKSGKNSSTIETTCGTNERYDAICYKDSDPDVYDRSKPVVLIITSKGKVCTGWRVGSENRLFTAGHCVGSQEDLDGAEIWFNYRASSCGSANTASEVKVTGAELLANDHTFDYSLFTVNDFASISKFGYLGLDVRNGKVGEGIFIPQHGLGQPRQLALESDMNTGGLCQIDESDHEGYAPGSDIGYFCDTTTSSSGSPVVSSVTGKVIALHHLGGCFNSGTKITKIWPQVSAHFDGVVPKADSGWDFEPENQVPEADFGISCDALNCELNASSSSDPDGEIVEFSWSLSDGTNASGTKVEHEFAKPGEYEVSLEVEDDEGATDHYVQTVSVLAPNQSPEAKFSVSCVGTDCSFDAGSSSDPDGSIVSWDWALGDGASASGQLIEYTYTEEGTYSVMLTVKDADDASDNKNHTISVNVPNKKPIAHFSVTCDEFDCDFDASDSSDNDGKLESYQWSFGDGDNANGNKVSHSYSAEGDFSITLTVQDDEGATASETQMLNIAATNDNPVANFSYSCNDKTCTLDAARTTGSDIVSYEWNFGDGQLSEGASVTHEFDRSGIYTVTLTVVDHENASANKARRIRIKPPELKLNGKRAGKTVKPFVTLSWTGAESDTVEIYRDGSLVTSTANDGKFTDLNMSSKSKPLNYVLCEPDSGRCSDEIVLAF